jgi:hypothetical protein
MEMIVIRIVLEHLIPLTWMRFVPVDSWDMEMIVMRFVPEHINLVIWN